MRNSDMGKTFGITLKTTSAAPWVASAGNGPVNFCTTNEVAAEKPANHSQKISAGATAAQIVGPLAQVSTCSVEPGASAEEIRDQVHEAVQRVDRGDGVVVLADLYGGSPCTASVSLCQTSNLEVVTGINLPMLLKAST